MTSSFVAAYRASKSSADVIHVRAEGPAATCGFLKLRHKRVIVTIHGACEMIGTPGEKPVKSRLSENSVFYSNSNTEYRIKKSYSGLLKSSVLCWEHYGIHTGPFRVGIPLIITCLTKTSHTPTGVKSSVYNGFGAKNIIMPPTTA